MDKNGVIFDNHKGDPAIEQENDTVGSQIMPDLTIDNTDTKISQLIHIVKKEHETLNNTLYSFLLKYFEDISSKPKDTTPIHVDEIASKLAKFYETVRKVVDWQEDNVLRRKATERILKRLTFVKLSGLSMYKEIDPSNLAETVVIELVRGGHLPNDEIPSEKIPKVAKILEKYTFFLLRVSKLSEKGADIKKQINFTNFLMEMAACEIEEVLTDPYKEYMLIDAMTILMNERITITPQGSISKEHQLQQVFIACSRKLYDLDDSFILYRILDREFPDWKVPDKDKLIPRLEYIYDFWSNSSKILDDPLSKDFNQICEETDTIFALLDDFLEKYKDKPKTTLRIIENRKRFVKEIGKFYDKRYQTLKRRLFRLGVFSTLSVFLSNWFTFFAVEVPLASIFSEGFSFFTAFIDFLVPTLVMFVLVIIIRPPSRKNKDRVLAAIESFVYKGSKKKLFEVKTRRRAGSILWLMFMILYLFITWLVFTVVGATFYLANLPISSVVFDTFTIALTVFAAVVIRGKSKELDVDEKTSFFEFILDMISVPIARVGSFFAQKWKEYNLIAIFFNFVIETPFAVVLNAIEGWNQFLKDRKSELR